MRYSDDIIEEVRMKNDIVDVISQYVKLTRRGSSYFGLCPFHNEKTPSFSVTPSKQMYYCFGCGAGGNVYNFIMEYENYSFGEALSHLADRAGVELPKIEYSREAKEKAEAMLRYFRLPEPLWDLYPNTFSGGERLRLNLAHTMVKQPRLMLLDEPTASLDNKTKILVKDMLMQLKEKGTSIIGIFHDLEFMDGLCDKVFNISEGTFQ